MAEAKKRLNPARILQIDVLKGLAIIAVIMQHTVTANDLLTATATSTTTTGIAFTGSVVSSAPSFALFGPALMVLLSLTTRQAVPIFVILLGVNSGMSFIRRGYASLKASYSKDYFKRRLQRFYVPFLMILAISLLIGLIETYISGINQIQLSIFALIGVVPIYAPGNYFILLVFQFVLVFPLFFYVYRRRPKLLLVACFVIGFLFQILFLFSQLISSDVYVDSILRFLPGIALGLWICEDLDLASKRNRFILLGTLVAVFFFVLNALSVYGQAVQPLSQLVGILYPFALFYPTLLVLAGIKYIPSEAASRVLSSVADCGKASYHIFLVQMLYFNLFTFFGILKLLNPTSNILLDAVVVAGNVVCCVVVGFLFKRGNAALKRQFQVLSTKMKSRFRAA
jgi:peptidoglycan/LPS O-acetylase OafA/YrhL